MDDVTPVDNQNQSTTIREEKSPQEINSEVMGEPVWNQTVIQIHHLH
ncbi:UNVERIFIED_ORG: hypothetical protein [Escherichia phage CMSTMSU]